VIEYSKKARTGNMTTEKGTLQNKISQRCAITFQSILMAQEITHQATATKASTIFSRCFVEYFLDYLSQLLYVLCF
jgi:hypothetical protein